ncbi:MAG: transporter substrate-binding domain-containing protein [Ruminococcaceae bacterium]|nr:transporter substrate-binding domain-containing protein [Oscillospiraceae bacterium]
MMKKVCIAMLALVLCLSMLASCGGNKDLNFGKEYRDLNGQMDVLLQLDAGNIDVGVMDSIMAGYYMTQDSKYSESLMIVEGLDLATEQYGIAARKGSGLIKMINEALVFLANEGTVDELAEKYGIKSEVCIDKDAKIEDMTADEAKDWEYICEQKQFIVGYTLFAPIAYEEDGELIGFDIELAKAVADVLDLDVKFELIDWSAKEAKLEAKAIDCIWNGMSITPEREEQMEISIPYLYNKQVAIIRVADKDKYTDKDSMARAIIGAEAGSAGEACIVKAKEE